jgi:16S rRNA processing protein RimM
VRGEIRLKSETEDPLNILKFEGLTDKSGEKAFILKKGRIVPKNPHMLVVSVEGITNREAAAKLTNTTLFIERTQLPVLDEDTFYHADLIGCTVKNSTGEVIGRVHTVQNYGAGDILILHGPKGEGLLPFQQATVPVVDLVAREITALIDPLWPEAPKNLDRVKKKLAKDPQT